MVDLQVNENESFQITEELTILKNQIVSLFNTPKNSILGVYSYGLELEELVYSLELSESQINQEINKQIIQWIPLSKKYMVEVKTKFFRGEVRDICLIDVVINGDKMAGFVIK